MQRPTPYKQNTTQCTIQTSKCKPYTTHCAIIYLPFFFFFTVCTGMAGDPARKVIPVLISTQPGAGLWRAKTRTCHSQDPGQASRVTRNVHGWNGFRDLVLAWL